MPTPTTFATPHSYRLVTTPDGQRHQLRPGQIVDADSYLIPDTEALVLVTPYPSEFKRMHVPAVCEVEDQDVFESHNQTLHLMRITAPGMAPHEILAAIVGNLPAYESLARAWDLPRDIDFERCLVLAKIKDVPHRDAYLEDRPAWEAIMARESLERELTTSEAIQRRAETIWNSRSRNRQAMSKAYVDIAVEQRIQESLREELSS